MENEMKNLTKVLSANCQHLRHMSKRRNVLNYLDKLESNIICLWETHLVNKVLGTLRNIWEGECLINGDKTNARGLAILIKPNFEYKIVNTLCNEDGNMIILDLTNGEMSYCLIIAYALTVDSSKYFSQRILCGYSKLI